MVNGVQREVGESQTFEVAALGGSTLQPQNPLEVIEFQRKTNELLRRALGSQEIIRSSSERLQQVRRTLFLTPLAASDLFDRTRKLESELADLKEVLEGDPIRRSLSEPILPGIIARLRRIVGGHWSSTYGPTRTHRRDFEIAARSFDDFRARLKQLVEKEMVRLEQDLEAARAPYTPGRSVP
jgi:hypothetical protein